MKLNVRSIGVKLLAYFSLFAAGVLGLIWLLQIVFLQSFYEDMKIREVRELANSLAEAYGGDNFETIAAKSAYSNSVLIYVFDSRGVVLYSEDEHSVGRGKGGRGRSTEVQSVADDYKEFLTELQNSENAQIYYVKENKEIDGKWLVVGVWLDKAALYVTSKLDPVDATTGILRTQLIYVSIASFLLGLVMAIVLSMKFSRPILAITNRSKELGKGNFVKFNQKGFCTELDELSDALNDASDELKKVESLRRELIANISHDLRTPLTMIKAYAEMVRDISGNNAEKREAHLGVIIGEADRLTLLVNDILALSAIQSSAEPLLMERYSITSLVREVVVKFEPIFDLEGLSIHVSAEDGLITACDPQKIQQVLYNLIGNAMNYVGDDKAVFISAFRKDGAVRVEVKDNGQGIAEEELPHIWERYYRAREHKRDKAGTGLGLSIVKEILEAHGARFGAQSHTGEGATFYFELNE